MDRAKGLRRRAGFAEDIVWQALRSGRVDGWKFRRQHPVGRLVVDFAYRKLRLVIGIDGEVHRLAEVETRERALEIEAAGWTVLRFVNDVAVTRATEIAEAVRRHATAVTGG